LFDWLQSNAAAISALASIGTLVIWLLYLTLFYREFRRSQLPHIVIKQGYRFDLDASCHVTNMSQQAVDVLAALVRVERDGEHATFLASALSEDPPDPRRIERPLHAGSSLELGTFRGLLELAQDHLPPASGDDGDPEVDLEIRVVALVGPQQVPRGARRRFRVVSDGGEPRVRPHDVLPQQLASRRQRRLARRWLEQAQDLKMAE
jgi:hypothetical protein